MPGLADLLTGRLAPRPAESPTLMLADVIQIDPIMVTIPALDNRLRAHRVFGYWPDAAEGDQMRVMHDENDGLVAVAWEPA